MNNKYISKDNLELVIDGLKIGTQADWKENDKTASGYVRNRTHYAEISTTPIVSKQDVTFDNRIARFFTDDSTANYNSSNCPLEVEVVFDEKKYRCVHVGTGRYGNISLFGSTADANTGEPFCVRLRWNTVQCWVADDMQTHSISISSLTETVHKLDEKYLPDTLVAAVETAQTTANNKMDATNPVGTGSFSMNRKADTTIGDYSVAEGYNTTASETYSHAEGALTTASGSNSHAEGYNTTASGSSSHAEGKASIASGDGSHAEGGTMFTSGGPTKASGEASHAEGAGTTASGIMSHAEGRKTNASGNYSHAEGDSTTASDLYSHAEGTETTASGEASHAEGDSTTASGNYSHAEGKRTIASGGASHAEGYDTEASGGASHAEGEKTIASGDSSHAEGIGTRATTGYQHAEGTFNIVDSYGDTVSRGKYAHIVGNGTSDTNRSNAHTLDWNGVGWFQGGLQVGGNAQDDGAKNVLLEGVPQNYIILNDAVTGAPYKLEIRNGNLVSSFMGSLDDFVYTTNEDGTHIITGWNETYMGEPSTELIVPIDNSIII